MGLYEKWTGDPELGTKIPVHPFGSALSELARGSITRQQVIDAFGLTDDNGANEIIELDAIIAKYVALPADEKTAFIGKLEDVMILCESGYYDTAKAKTELGF